MANSYFRFKQFTVHQELAAMKVTTDACLFGAWVAEDLHRQSQAPDSILDIGTGTGLLSLMVAQQVGSAIDAVELDAAAAMQAERNFLQSPWSGQLRLLHADIREARLPYPYNVIISNPPFYEKELTASNRQKNIAHHDAGLVLRELIPIISGLLENAGSFYLLLPYKRLNEAFSLIAGSGLHLYRICKVRQSTGHSFFRVLIKGGRKYAEPEQEEMAIRTSENSYTREFRQLLGDYYLQL
ncbi:MAG: tRNA1(Val) (adenine(37)-N6)-methyltransferase [Chitinophagaceae bacterium]